MPRRAVDSPDNRWLQNILEYIAEHPQRPLKVRALARQLDIPEDQYPAFRGFVQDQIRAGRLVLRRNRTVGLPAGPEDALQGVFQLHRHGFGFVTLAGQPDLYIPATHTADAHDGDTVIVRKLRRGGRHGQPAGEIVQVVRRAHPHWVGVAERSGERWFVRPQGRTPGPLVLLDRAATERSVLGQMVVVEPAGPGPEPRSVLGRVIEVLGDPALSRTKVLAVARRFNLPPAFPAEVQAYADTLTSHFDPVQAFADREDLRRTLTLTIDPADAKDFDDAISIRVLPHDGYELGVHIADVAYFVSPESPLDREARQRGNSSYFPGYVVPMLPEALSNGLCSLRPNEDRLTRSAFIRYDVDGAVVGARFANTVIRSAARLVYEDVSAALAGERSRVPAQVLDLLTHAERLARRIRARRLREGMISLSLAEVYIELDADGQVRDARPADTSFSHTLIEMFMVEANEAVCRELTRRDVPHLRRVHPEPDPDGLERLGHMLGLLDIAAPVDHDRLHLQALVDRVRGTPAEPLVNYLLLRSFAPAEYSPDPDIGHYALASEHYAHFTSPIRRYPDLGVHRALDALIRAAPLDDLPADDELEQLGRDCTDTERRSQTAEREARQWLLLDLMSGKLGEHFDALITGVVPAGVFVQIQPHMAEGFVRVDDFGPDEWEFDEDGMRFIAHYGGRVVSLGQTCRVEVAAVDELRRELALVPADVAAFGHPLHGAGEPTRRRPPAARRSPRGRSAGGAAAGRGGGSGRGGRAGGSARGRRGGGGGQGDSAQGARGGTSSGEAAGRGAAGGGSAAKPSGRRKPKNRGPKRRRGR